MLTELLCRVLGSSVRHQGGFGQKIPPELRSPESAWLAGEFQGDICAQGPEAALGGCVPAVRVEAPLQRAVLASLLLLCCLLGWDVCFAAGSVVAPACWPCTVSVLLCMGATGRCSSSRYPRQNPKLVTNSIFLEYPLDTVLQLVAGGRSHPSRAASIRLRGWWTRAAGSWEQNSGC